MPLVQDLRFSLRMLARSRGFTTVAIVALALGIGANTVIFSVANALILKPLPYQDGSRLVVVFSSQKQIDLPKAPSTDSEYSEWRKQNTVFEKMGAEKDDNLNLTGDGDPERLAAGLVTASAFETLSVSPSLGRGFTTDDETPGHNQVAVLGHGLWQRRFGGQRSVIGRKILLNGRPYEVIGVMPRRFDFPQRREIWTPFRPPENDAEHRGRHSLTVIARLKPGVSIEQAQTEMTGIAKRVESQIAENTGWTATVISLHEELVSDTKPLLTALLGAVAFVLMIACANVANLLLARSSVRRREVAIRAALGAGRGRLLYQFLLESLILGLAGGAMALLPALWGIDVLKKIAESMQVATEDIQLDATVLLFTLAVSLLTGLLFGLAPALQASRTDLAQTLKQGGKGSRSEGGRLRSLLVLAEVTLSLVLLVGAGLMMRTFLAVSGLKPGFNPERVITYNVSLPLTGSDHGNGLFLNDRPDPERGHIPITYRRDITPDYLRAMEIPLLKGRAFTLADTENSQKVAIINERTARKFWPGAGPLGKEIRFGGDRKKNPPFTIIGVAADVHAQTLSGAATYEVYLPCRQSPASDMYLVVRTKDDPASVTPQVRSALRELDPELPLFNVRTMQSYVAEAAAETRVGMLLFGIFAAIALALAGVGIYGVSATDPLVLSAVVGILTVIALIANYVPARRASKVDPLIALRYE